MNLWGSGVLVNGYAPFGAYWASPLRDYKGNYGDMFDAYGNFEYGATGAADQISSSTLTGVADMLHLWSNSPINTTDILSGFNAIAQGGTLGIIDYNPPSLGSCH